MQHHPEVIHQKTKTLTNLFTSQTVDLAQRKRTRRSRWKWRQAIVEDPEEITLLEQIRRRGVPIAWRVIRFPMTGPLACATEELIVLRPLVLFFADGRLSHKPSEMIRDLVFENAYQPCALGSATLKSFISPKGGEKSFLHGIFGC